MDRRRMMMQSKGGREKYFFDGTFYASSPIQGGDATMYQHLIRLECNIKASDDYTTILSSATDTMTTGGNYMYYIDVKLPNTLHIYQKGGAFDVEVHDADLENFLLYTDTRQSGYAVAHDYHYKKIDGSIGNLTIGTERTGLSIGYITVLGVKINNYASPATPVRGTQSVFNMNVCTWFGYYGTQTFIQKEDGIYKDSRKFSIHNFNPT